ncbi:hypothetical protein [Bacillus horti]|uniref:Uncharacterized protein n=1 Tax=Caldalkalibacillus horti TaxID=77523 RepID=A0ABT9W2E7_9BACI|nr:hypothetical protein [Bacillus horti]MDQ0167425.1 hypothetical protein [Bacillus horti]
MEWVHTLSAYIGRQMKVWIEDYSGEEQTKPADYTLHKVQTTSEGTYLQFYLNPNQFLSVPIFDQKQTYMESDNEEECFVSNDVTAKLFYRIYFSKS